MEGGAVLSFLAIPMPTTVCGGNRRAGSEWWRTGTGGQCSASPGDVGSAWRYRETRGRLARLAAAGARSRVARRASAPR